MQYSQQFCPEADGNSLRCRFHKNRLFLTVLARLQKTLEQHGVFASGLDGSL